MAIRRHNIQFERLTPEALAAWGEIPPAVASDCNVLLTGPPTHSAWIS